MFSQRVKAECEPEDFEVFLEEGLTENPADYYFGIQEHSDSLISDIEINIVPKKLFDGSGYWSDSGSIGFLLQPYLNGYDELMEACFEPNNNQTVEQIRQELQSRGFIENKEIYS